MVWSGGIGRWGKKGQGKKERKQEEEEEEEEVGKRQVRRDKGRGMGEDMEGNEVGAYGISTMRARADRLHVTLSDSPHCPSWQLLIIKCVSGI